MNRLAIFASGTGSNTKKLIEYFRGSSSIEIVLIVSNKSKAGVLQIADDNNIPTLVIEKERFYNGDHYLTALHAHNINYIILAGFLLKIPQALIVAYPQKIINIHPALLPRYGGKGMYGHFVHEAIITAGEKQSGITIHFVDEHYDHGEHIFQAVCDVLPEDTPDSLAQKIHKLEHTHFGPEIEKIINQQTDYNSAVY